MARISDERPRQALITDVLVVGGGAAGLAAATTAAKTGARVLDGTGRRAMRSGSVKSVP